MWQKFEKIPYGWMLQQVISVTVHSVARNFHMTFALLGQWDMEIEIHWASYFSLLLSINTILKFYATRLKYSYHVVDGLIFLLACAVWWYHNFISIERFFSSCVISDNSDPKDNFFAIKYGVFEPRVVRDTREDWVAGWVVVAISLREPRFVPPEAQKWTVISW